LQSPPILRPLLVGAIMVCGVGCSLSDLPCKFDLSIFSDNLLKQNLNAMKVKQWLWLYMLECDNGRFYTGYTKNLAIRYYQHKEGKQSARYTQSFKPVRIAQCWRLFDEVGTALKVERFIKKCDRTTKERWVHHPEELGVIVSKKLGLDLVLLPFDSLIVEKESEKLDWKMVKSGHDPFAQISPSVGRGT